MLVGVVGFAFSVDAALLLVGMTVALLHVAVI